MASEIDTVLMAVDGSEDSEHAVRFYLGNLYRPGTKIHLVTVKEYWMDSVRMMSVSKLEEVIAETNAHVAAIQQKFEKILQEYDVVPTMSSPVGSEAWQCIVSEAERLKAALIVLGSRGLGKFRRTILGSVSDSVLHHTDIPVLVCKIPRHH